MTQPNATQIYRLFIRTTPTTLWDAITTPEFTVKYFYGSAVDTEGVPDGRFHYHSPDGTQLWSDGTVLEWDPPRRLVHTWRSLYQPEARDEPASRVTWEIDERDGYCLLTVVHDRLDESPITAENVGGEGWMLILSGLKTLLETGQPMQAK